MSFILEALRKSERERERRTLPAIAEAPLARAPGPRLPLVLGGLAVVLLLNVVLVAVLALRPATVAPLPPAAPRPPARTPIARAAREVRPLGAEASAPAAEAAAPGSVPPIALPLAKFASPTPAAGAGGVPLLGELPADVGVGLEHLNIDLHVYSSDPAQRFVVINGQRLAEGGQLREGATLERITPDGAVLSARGSRFRLPRS